MPTARFEMFLFENDEKCSVFSVFLRQPSVQQLTEFERQIINSIKMVKNILSSEKPVKQLIVPSGGAFESWLAAKIRKYAKLKENQVYEVLFEAVAESLMEIPFSLAKNIQIDAANTCALLEQHYSADNDPPCDFGVDCDTQELASIIKSLTFDSILPKVDFFPILLPQ